ncbi:hypothetical protein EVAR_83299_1 [Eumeta japonica]|uniref:Uncharacterized protein n=1 Tax=Eumeta variegata TaxID=151549 RepID=A0A4C2A345_EUMVA|nr:hypothetical protein EVAR_83299_1 [Eumeta japonica]
MRSSMFINIVLQCIRRGGEVAAGAGRLRQSAPPCARLSLIDLTIATANWRDKNRIAIMVCHERRGASDPARLYALLLPARCSTRQL